VALDRQSIEKKDFPIGRRGYDPEAVDVHLSSLADQIESSGGSTESLAASAGEQVRAIVEVAETTAAQIRTEADRQAKKLLADARKEVRTARDAAAVEAGEHVAKISQSAASMLERIDAMEQEANSLLASLRTGADRLGADLRLLEGNLADIKAAIAPEEPEEDQDPELLVAAVVVEEEEELDADDEPEAVAAPAAEAPTAVAEAIPAAEPAPEGEGAGDVDDIEGARLIALNMALNGNSREDIDRYLDENFDLANRDALLDEVYASVEG
jgi:DivIVA domain-containing protein